MPTFTINKKGGYETFEVDAYINSLEQQIKEYENKASAINKAIISAQMASDKMIKQANEDVAATVKKAKDDAVLLVKKAKEEADAILKKANEEKEKVEAQTKNLQVSLAQNTATQIKDIKANIAQYKEIINSFSKDYNAMVEKYFKNFDAEGILNMTKDFDKIDEVLTEWQKSGVPKPTPAPAPQKQVAQTIPTHKVPSFGGLQKMASQEVKAVEQPKTDPKPSPLATSSIPNKVEEQPKAEPPKTASPNPEAPKAEQPKPFVKTGLAGGGGMGGIPANPSYGLGGERTLRSSVNHSEAPKTTEPAPEPVSAANVNVPKFDSEPAPKVENTAPKPGIYKVTADNHLYNENKTSEAAPSQPQATANPASSQPQAAPQATANPASSQPQAAPQATANSAPSQPQATTEPAQGTPQTPQSTASTSEKTPDTEPAPITKPGVYKVSDMSPKPGIYKVTADNKLINDNAK